MKNKIWLITLVFIVTVFAACSNDSEEVDESEELKMLDVDFELPETADVGEAVELKATVTYGDDDVTDAEQMEFEYWKDGDKDNSTFVDGENNEDGTYTAEVSFEEEGVYEIYAHTTAESLHTMPKKEIEVGDVSDGGEVDDENEDES